MSPLSKTLCLALLLVAGARPLASAQEHTLWFPVGERLVYDMNWGLLPVGTTVVESDWLPDHEPRLLRIRYTTRTTPFLDRVYKVDDLIETWIDPASFLPVRFRKRLEEGSFRCDEITTFDRAQGRVRWESRLDGRVIEYPAPPDLRDIVSLMYLLRKTAFEPGTTNSFPVAGDRGVTEIAVRSLARARLNLPRYGMQWAQHLKPIVSDDPLFDRKIPDQVWISTDARQVMLKLTVDVPVGHISMLLSAVEGPGDDAWVRRDAR